jgi:hypothetical protein
MTRTRVLIVVVLALGILGGELYVVVARRARVVPPRMRLVTTLSASLEIKTRQVGPGALVFGAVATNVGIIHKPDSKVWWVAEVSFLPEEGGHSVVWSHEYTEPGNVKRVINGSPIEMVLKDQLVPVDLKPGQYAVYVEVREDTPVVNLDGTREESNVEVGRSVYPEIVPMP